MKHHDRAVLATNRERLGIKPMKKATSVDEYIKSASKEIRTMLSELRRAIKKSAPKATERISYGMPFYEYGGTGYKGRLIYFSAFKNHVSLFIPPSLGGYPKMLEDYRISKAAFHFPLNRPLPIALIGKAVKAIVKERDAENKTGRKPAK